MVQVHGHSNRTYEALGRVLLHKHPELAEELLPLCQTEGETDMNKIPGYFKKFCELRQVNLMENIGDLRSNRERMENRMLFVATMLHIYNYHIFHTHGAPPIFRRGFVKSLAECISISPSNISQLIRNVMVHERVYDSFRADIQSIVPQLKKV